MFYFGRRFATSGSPESIAWWNGLWQYPDFRNTQTTITVVWGIAFIAEAALHIWLIYRVSVSTAVAAFNMLPYIVLAARPWTVPAARLTLAG